MTHVNVRLGLIGAVVLVAVAVILIPQTRGKGMFSMANTGVPADTTLQGVPALKYVDAKVNAFAQALDNVLQHQGNESRYNYYVSMSASAFRTHWSTDSYYQRGSHGGPDWNAELDDNALMVQATGMEALFLGNKDFRNPLQHAAIDSWTDNEGIRKAVTKSIGNQGGAVVALMELSHELGWRIFTGYEQEGRLVAGWPGIEPNRPTSVGDGWSGFDPKPADGFAFQSDGSFKATDWESRVAALVVITGTKATGKGADQTEPYRLMLTRASELLVEGAAAYDSAMGVLDDDVSDIPDSVLISRLGFLSMVFLGDNASNRYYSSEFLKQIASENTGLDTNALHEAVKNCVKVHDLVWKCWDIAGHYQRKQEEEVQKFRKKENREKIAEILREMKQLDLSTAEKLRSAAGIN